MRKTIQIMIQPGTGLDTMDVDGNQSLQDFVLAQSLQHHQISVNGNPIAASAYGTMRMMEVNLLWAAQPVKGAIV